MTFEWRWTRYAAKSLSKDYGDFGTLTVRTYGIGGRGRTGMARKGG